jgi:hypothetical protein
MHSNKLLECIAVKLWWLISTRCAGETSLKGHVLVLNMMQVAALCQLRRGSASTAWGRDEVS